MWCWFLLQHTSSSTSESLTAMQLLLPWCSKWFTTWQLEHSVWAQKKPCVWGRLLVSAGALHYTVHFSFSLHWLLQLQHLVQPSSGIFWWPSDSWCTRMHNESEYRGFVWWSFHRAVTISVLPEEAEALHNLLLDKAEDDIKLAPGSSGSQTRQQTTTETTNPNNVVLGGLTPSVV